jgi:undecaprenyl pyrophosphate phosphatase UppP
MIKKLSFLILSVFYFLNNSIAQVTDKAFDAKAIDVLKQDGKIYIVIAVIVIILLGLFFYLWRIDKKLTRMEQQK